MLKILSVEWHLKEAGKYIPIKRNNDVFKSELTLFSEHIWYGNSDISIHNNVPIDVLYKSNPSGERVFLVIDAEYSKRKNLKTYRINNIIFINNIILNIDGKKNIKVEKNYDTDLNDERFEIKKEQLYELCMASSLKIQINGSDGVLWESEADSFITVLQALYNEAFDNSAFTDANNIIRSDFEGKLKKYEERERKQRVESKQNEKLWVNFIWILIILIIGGAMLLGFLLF